MDPHQVEHTFVETSDEWQDLLGFRVDVVWQNRSSEFQAKGL